MFLKWIKRDPKIKLLIGISKNAVMTQIWIALCVYLLLAFIKIQVKLKKSIQQTRRLLQFNLLEKQDLMALLRGDPLHDRKINSNHLALLWKLTAQQ